MLEERELWALTLLRSHLPHLTDAQFPLRFTTTGTELKLQVSCLYFLQILVISRGKILLKPLYL